MKTSRLTPINSALNEASVIIFMVCISLMLSALPAMANKAMDTKPDFSQYKDVKQKKQAFFEYLNPFIQQANAEIRAQRQWIQSLDFANLTAEQTHHVQNLVKQYRLKYPTITAQTQRTLLKKIDIIPASLALAQAANESSWGTSRFAVQANNFFGQWCFTKGCGLVPLRRPEGQTHEVKRFEHTLDSVRAYMLVLNSHPAFKPLRDARRQARQTQPSVDGLTLVEGLEPYSARKQVYVKTIASMIRSNRLQQFDS